MNRTIFLSTAAALATAAVQPVEAKDRGDARDGRGGNGGGAKVQAQANRAPNASVRPQGRAFQAPTARIQAPSARAQFQPRVNRTPAIVNNRSFQANNRRSPSIAFGGTSVRNVNRQTNVRNVNRFNNTVVRNDFRRPSFDVYRNWDRGHVHSWNNNRYRWSNNSWVVLGGAYAPYYYDSSPYYSGDYDYDYDAPASVSQFAPTDNLAVEVQQRLEQRGYNTGGTDGVVGPQTRNAIASFQSDQGLGVTGRIDGPLLRELGLQ